MPLFDFRCHACAQIVELLVAADARPACPACGHAELEKLVASPVAPGRSAAIIAGARAAARREGHLSNL